MSRAPSSEATDSGAALTLPLRLAAGGDELELVVDASPGATVAELGEAVRRNWPRFESRAYFLARADRWLESAEPLAGLGLAIGDLLEVDPAAAQQGEEERVWRLLVAGGPAAGRTIRLANGTYTIGRLAECDIALPDAALSGRHLRLELGEEVTVEDLGSRNGSACDGVRLPDGGRTWPEGSVLQIARTSLRLEHVRPSTYASFPSADGSCPFNRQPRIPVPPGELQFEVGAPPSRPRSTRVPLIASLAPILLGVVLWLVTKNPTMLFFAALSPVMIIGTLIEDRRGSRREQREKSKDFRQELVDLKPKLEAARRESLGRMRAETPDLAEVIDRAKAVRDNLWERRPDDPDFLQLRLGSSERPSGIAVQLGAGGSEELRAEAERLIEWYERVPQAPLSLPLREVGAIGLAGSREAAEALARSLVIQAATLHSPRELAIVGLLSGTEEGWGWLKWLPHVRSMPSGLDAPLAYDQPACRELLTQLLGVRTARAEDRSSSSGPAWARQLLVVIDEHAGLARADVSRLLDDCAEDGLAVIWIGAERKSLPGECRAVIELDSEVARLDYARADTGDRAEDVTTDWLSPALARDTSLALAPLRDVTTTDSATQLPESVGLLELLELHDVSGSGVAERWQAAGDDLRARIGAGRDGPLELDLRFDGPHALIAGMTGSGKSEFLQSLIASLALSHSPRRLNFLFVDYKGGAAFQDCVRLPHTVGLVTDLEGALTERALRSLNAELRRREGLFREAHVIDIREMERVAPADCPANLAIVIDEFAALKAEVPEFIDGIVDVAHRGRSLGVHLVLATQRPAGIVSENIRANTNLRVALRFNSVAESSDVIGVPDAAHIPRSRPGRAFVRTGPSELVEVQAAYVGGASTRRSSVEGVRVALFGSPATDEPDSGAGAAEAMDTDLERIVEACIAAAELSAIAEPFRPWMTPLPSVLPLTELAVSSNGAAPAIGLIDEPDLQRQEPLALDLEQTGSMLVFGGAGSGKTTLLQTVAVALATSSAPSELQLFGLDFASRALTPIEALPHCGSVIPGDDEERVRRLLALLRTTIEDRRRLVAAEGAATLGAYNERRPAESRLPRLVTLLDGYLGFATTFERVDGGRTLDELQRLVADGRPVGVNLVITAERRGGVPTGLSGIIGRKLVLRLDDEDDYAVLGVPGKAVRGRTLPPGRGFVDGVEVQIALAAAAPEGIAAIAAELSERHAGLSAQPIRTLPTEVDRGELPEPARELLAYIGIADATLQPIAVDLGERHLLVAAPYHSGRSNALAVIADGLWSFAPGLEAHLLAPRARTPLLADTRWTSTARGADEVEAAAVRLAELVSARAGAEHHAPLMVFVDDADEVADTAGARALENVVKRGRDVNVRVVAAGERQAVQRAFSGWLHELKKDQHGLQLDPNLDIDGALFGTQLPRRANLSFPPGRGYLVHDGRADLVQVARGA